jgi:hypothetical protein
MNRTNEKGSIMLEYVIVLTAIGVAMLWFSNVLFYTGLTKGSTTEWGPLGQQLVAFYQRTLGGLSLPVP